MSVTGTPVTGQGTLISDLIERVRITLSDQDTDNPRFSDGEITKIFDEASLWLLDQASLHKADIGTAQQTITGDGSDSFGTPAAFYKERYFWYNDGRNSPPLNQASQADYDRGMLDRQTNQTNYYVINNGLIRFIKDLPEDDTVLHDYYYKPDFLVTTASSPFEGLFDNLLVYWAEYRLLDVDEYSTTQQQRNLELEKSKAREQIVKRGYWSGKKLKTRADHFMNVRGRIKTRRGRYGSSGSCACTGRCGCGSY
jgi:hypothetical protein